MALGTAPAAWSNGSPGTSDRTGSGPSVTVAAESAPPIVAGVLSRKAHGTAGTFDLALGLDASSPTIEPRSGGAGGNHTIVFTFNKSVTGGASSVTAGTATAGAPSFGGNEVVVPLADVAAQQYVTVAVDDVTASDGSAGGSASVRIGFLLGDVTRSGVVTVSDLAQVNAGIAQPVTAANYLQDVNGSGTLTVADKAIANAQIAKALPSPALPPPRVVSLNRSLSSPWGLAFLPDGRMLVTQKRGTMVLLSPDGATVLATLTGVPPVDTSGQGGLLDVAVDPQFDAQTNPWIYWTYAESGAGGKGTAVARGRLVGSALQDVAVIFRQVPKTSASSNHYGSRLVFRADGTLFVTLGDRQLDSPSQPTNQYAQNVANHLGKVVRIHRDGSVPSGNPAFGTGARPELWSIGHRNPQGAAIHPSTGELWLVEHGPQGGDELNRIVPGSNYGWPLRSYGCPYGSPVGEACRVGGGTHAPSFVEPVSYWVPTSIAPAGMIFYTGDRFPEWRGNVLFGALAGTALWRITLNGNSLAARERLFGDLGERIRHVRQGPDGWIYLLTDSGWLLRVER
jgi:glucose/arabinose dehydrogenase